MPTITLHLTTAEAKLLRLALSSISIASTHFVKADTLQRKIGHAVALHELARKNIQRAKKS